MSRNGRAATTKTRATKATGAKRNRAQAPPLSSAARARLAAWREHVREREAAWEKMSAAEQREAVKGWERAMQDLNDTRGYRKVYIGQAHPS